MLAVIKHVFYLWFAGVGKTSLVHLLAHSEPILNPYWTIGCSVEVKVRCQFLLQLLGLVLLHSANYNWLF